jgi:hypothetical protein
MPTPHRRLSQSSVSVSPWCRPPCVVDCYGHVQSTDPRIASRRLWSTLVTATRVGDHPVIPILQVVSIQEKGLNLYQTINHSSFEAHMICDYPGSQFQVLR